MGQRLDQGFNQAKVRTPTVEKCVFLPIDEGGMFCEECKRVKLVTRLAPVIGLAVIVLGLAQWHAVKIAAGSYDLTSSTRFGWVLGYIALLAVSAYSFGLPDLPRSRRSIVFASVSAVAVSGLGISLAQFVLGGSFLPRFVVLGSAIIAVPWLWICADFASDARRAAGSRDRVLVVGSWLEADELSAEIEHSAERAASIVAVADPDELSGPDGADLLAGLVTEHDANVVVLDRESLADDDVVSQVVRLHASGTRVRTLSMFYEEWLGKVPVSELERISMLFDIGEVHKGRYGRQRRLFDIALSLAGVLALMVVAPTVWLANQFGNRGPLLYRQTRVGHLGKPFEILKFRSMTTADTTTDWTADDDHRITRFGGLLRTTHLDELPQVVNVLRGELSFVGPRPEQQKYVDELREKIPFYDIRHLVTPGITGWAQVKYGYASSESDAIEKLQYDFYYLRNQRLALDGRILARTFRSVILRDGV